MCIKHNPDLLKHWRHENRGNDVIVAYKVIWKDNTSLIYNNHTWTVGIHQIIVQKLKPLYPSRAKRDSDELSFTGRGFYVYLHRNYPFVQKSKYEDSSARVIAVYVKPKDVVYMGYDRTTILVCRALEVKSLRGLKE